MRALRPVFVVIVLLWPEHLLEPAERVEGLGARGRNIECAETQGKRRQPQHGAAD